ncbi:MAG: hypothetical protein RL728_690 [Bacteroidota bacterium]|jgi:hypothetical protein
MDIFLKCLNISYIILGSCFIGYKIKSYTNNNKSQTIDE